MIKEGTQMLLFRFSNYKKNLFIEEHRKVIAAQDYVWMMKIGKRTSPERVKKIIDDGGYLVFKSPVADGNKFYIGHIVDFCEDEPDDSEHMPTYYEEIRNDDEYWDMTVQFFKIDSIEPLDSPYEQTLVLSKNKRRVVDVINETRTAVMFVENNAVLKIDK